MTRGSISVLCSLFAVSLFAGIARAQATAAPGAPSAAPATRPANRGGVGGPRTQHVLWRLDAGEVEGISPKVAVVMIGTNNLGSNSNEEIAAADAKIVQSLHAKLPNTKVLLLGIFPRDEKPDTNNRNR